MLLFLGYPDISILSIICSRSSTSLSFMVNAAYGFCPLLFSLDCYFIFPSFVDDSIEFEDWHGVFYSSLIIYKLSILSLYLPFLIGDGLFLE